MDEIFFEIDKNGKYFFVKEIPNESEITIPSYIMKGEKYHAVKKIIDGDIPQRSVKSIVIEEGIESIGSSAFEDYTNLEKISFPMSLTSIGEFAFFNCKKLKTIEGGSGIVEIGRSAFQNCESITEITIPNNVKKIEAWTFAGCKRLRTITMGDAISHIGHQAFAWCEDLEEFTILSVSVTLGYDVFYNMKMSCKLKVPFSCDKGIFGEQEEQCNDFIVSSLDYFSHKGVKYQKNPKAPNNNTKVIDNNDFVGTAIIPSEISFNDITYRVNEISSYAFKGCKGLTSVIIPHSIEKIGEGAFALCPRLNTIIVNDNPNYYSDPANRTLIRKNDRTLVSYAIGNEAKTYTIPLNISIGAYAFAGFRNLERITFLSQEPPEINNSAFNDAATSECKVFVPLKCKEKYFNVLNKWGFDKKSIIDSGQFQNIQGIWFKVLYSNEEKKKGWVEVYKNKDLVGKIIINEKIEFAGFTYTVIKIGNDAFLENKNTTFISLPDTIEKIGCNAFRRYYPNSLIAINKLPKSLKIVGNFAFRLCKFDSFELPDSLEVLNSGSFELCKIDKNVINIPATTRIINGNPFIKIPIEKFKVSEHNPNYTTDDKGVLVNKDFKELIAFPSGSNIIIYSIPSTVEIINQYAFEGCNKIEKIIIPSSVKKLFGKCFGGCAFKEIRIDSNEPPKCDDSLADSRLYASCTLMVPQGYVEKYKKANGWKKFKNITDNTPVVFRYENINYKVVSFKNRTVEVADNTSFIGKAQIPSLVEYVGGKYTVIKIGDQAFKNNSNLTSITLPSTIYEIGKEAFSNAGSLRSLVIPKNVRTIYSSAFYKLNISEIHVMPENPPTILQNEISNTITHCILRVLKNKIPLYKDKKGWRKFHTIEEISNLLPTSGISGYGLSLLMCNKLEGIKFIREKRIRIY